MQHLESKNVVILLYIAIKIRFLLYCTVRSPVTFVYPSPAFPFDMPKAPIRPRNTGFPRPIQQFEENDRADRYASFRQRFERAVRRSTAKPTPAQPGPNSKAESLPQV